MRSYLSLIPISSKVRRRQNRMTLLCIVFAVFLVTGIFSMADTFIQSETANARERGGNWHINLENLSEEEAEAIAGRPDVAASSWFDMINMEKDRNYTINGIQTVLCGIEEPFRKEIMTYFPEERLSGGSYSLPVGSFGRGTDDLRQFKQCNRPEDPVLRHDAVYRYEQKTGDSLCGAGGAELVQDCGSFRNHPWHRGHMAFDCFSALFCGW